MKRGKSPGTLALSDPSSPPWAWDSFPNSRAPVLVAWPVLLPVMLVDEPKTPGFPSRTWSKVKASLVQDSSGELWGSLAANSKRNAGSPECQTSWEWRPAFTGYPESLSITRPAWWIVLGTPEGKVYSGWQKYSVLGWTDWHLTQQRHITSHRQKSSSVTVVSFTWCETGSIHFLSIAFS